MKKVYRYISAIIVLPILTIIIGFSGNDNKNNAGEIPSLKHTEIHENRIAGEISLRKSSGNFRDVNLFTAVDNADLRSIERDFVLQPVILKLDKAALSEIMASKPENITLQIPGTGTKLLLYKTEIFSKDFKITLTAKEGNTTASADRGVHYRGIEEGDNNSMASLSIYNNNVMGFISSKNGNYVLGSVKGKQNEGEFIFYNNDRVLNRSKYVCETGENGIREKIEQQINTQYDTLTPCRAVNIYFEADYSVYQYFGGNINNILQFIAGVFNQVAAIYINENIPLVFYSYWIWGVPDPYMGSTNPFTILGYFTQYRQNNLSGADIGQLISFRLGSPGAGYANLGVLCKTYNPGDNTGRTSFSSIEPFYNIYPAFSNSVDLVAHELGHNFGSRHTHWCGWQGGPIDTCVVTAENQPCVGNIPPRPKEGTIMSYCVPVYGGTTNFALGFGPQPGNTIRTHYFSSPCMCMPTGINNNNGVPQSFEVRQNYPNPFNPVTNIEFSIPVKAFVTLVIYNASGEEVTRIVGGELTGGKYSYTWDGTGYSSGIYFYQLTAGEFSETRKMVMVK